MMLTTCISWSDLLLLDRYHHLLHHLIRLLILALELREIGPHSNTKATADNIASHAIQLVIGLGDYCYCDSPDSWWNGPLTSINYITFRGAQGNHDADSGSSEYLKLSGLHLLM